MLHQNTRSRDWRKTSARFALHCRLFCVTESEEIDTCQSPNLKGKKEKKHAFKAPCFTLEDGPALIAEFSSGP